MVSTLTVEAPPSCEPSWRARHRWWVLLGAITLVGLGVRVGFVLGFQNPSPVDFDALYFHEAANLLADGEGFVNPLRLHLGVRAPGATHPPAYIMVLAVPSALGFHGALAHQLVSSVIGASAVIVLGLAGREIAGPRVGLVAAMIVAVYPDFWINDGLLMSESLVVPLVALAILFTYRMHRRPTVFDAAALGVACVGAAMTRGELLLLVPLLLVPLAWRFRRHSRGLLLVGLSALVALVALAPWPLYNATRFDRPVLTSTQLGTTFNASNCDATYFTADRLGSWSYPCAFDGLDRKGVDDSVVDALGRDRAATYVREHLDRLPVVVAARIGRVFGVYRPGQQVELDREEGRPVWVARAGLLAFYAIGVAAIPGLFVLRRRGVVLWPLFAVMAIAVVSIVAVYGATRFRLSAEVALVVPAASAVTALPTKVGTQQAAGTRS